MLVSRNIAALVCFFLSFHSEAQVSDGEGYTPMEGVLIPKSHANQPQAVKPGLVFKDCGECPEMVVIPAGSFMMGSPPDPEQDPSVMQSP